jgi:hypothetical protein
MKRIKDYLIESKKTYDFKIKIAGDLPEKFESTLKTALEKYSVSNMSKSKTPIQKVPLDFPNSQCSEVHIFEISLDYPEISPILRNYIVEKTGIDQASIVVRSPNEPTEEYQDTKEEKYKVKLESDYENEPKNQSLAGEKRVFDLLKELSKESDKKGEVSIKEVTKSDNNDSILGTKKMPEPKGTRK